MTLRGLGTGKQGEAHGVAAEEMSPTSRNSWISWRTNYAWAGERRIGGRCAGGPKVWISKGATSAGWRKSCRSSANASRWS